MTDTKENKDSGARKTTKPKTLSLTKTVEGGKVKQNFQRGRTKTVTVEVKKTRTFTRQKSGGMVEVAKNDTSKETKYLSAGEKEARLKALKEAENNDTPSALDKAPTAPRRSKKEESEKQAEKPSEKTKSRVDVPLDDVAKKNLQAVKQQDKFVDVSTPVKKKKETEEKGSEKKKIRLKESSARRQSGKLTVNQALGLGEERMRSLASIKRQRAKAKRADEDMELREKRVRDVVIPEVITVQELANRMAERAVDVIKELMKLGTMATANQTIDADTAQLVAEEMGHRVKRVSDADVEDILVKKEDAEEDLKPRPPVVTVMGHVDHGKTSLLDALRKTDVVATESGGITQHIGAYQVKMGSGDKITFLDTPGHAAFTAMRARGAHVTDIVILVVAADDGIMPQTEEAISHARSANVPIVVAINKMDKPDADADKVKNMLMNYEIVAEEFGGDVQCVPVSALQGTGLTELEEAVLLQSELIECKANPDAKASGTVVEAKVDKGRGTVATFLVQRGTLRVGDIVVAGAAYGKVRSLIDDKGRQLEEAIPSQPVEILGLNTPPAAGDEFAVVENEKVARDISEYREKKEKERMSVVTAKSMDQLFAVSAGTAAKELPLLIKGDVQGSIEAIAGSIAKFDDQEVKATIMHQGVGGINESDISLAQATGAMILAFNVRATPKAKEMADQEGIVIRYYSVIYDLLDDVKQALSGLLTPDKREEMLGYAEIRDIFNISKVGKVAGCFVTDGAIKRGAKVRLLRDNVVIHEGTLKTLKRFKEEVKEVKNNLECGMAFENYDDLKVGDMIEAFEVIEVARSIAEKAPEELKETVVSDS